MNQEPATRSDIQHPDCSNCKHKIYEYEMRISYDSFKSSWKGTMLQGIASASIKDMLSSTGAPMSITRTFSHGSYEYRKITR